MYSTACIMIEMIENKQVQKRMEDATIWLKVRHFFLLFCFVKDSQLCLTEYFFPSASENWCVTADHSVSRTEPPYEALLQKVKTLEIEISAQSYSLTAKWTTESANHFFPLKLSL